MEEVKYKQETRTENENHICSPHMGEEPVRKMQDGGVNITQMFLRMKSV